MIAANAYTAMIQCQRETIRHLKKHMAINAALERRKLKLMRAFTKWKMHSNRDGEWVVVDKPTGVEKRFHEYVVCDGPASIPCEDSVDG